MMESILREYFKETMIIWKRWKMLINNTKNYMKFNLEGNAPMIRKILYSLVIFFLIFATMGCSISKILPIQQDETQEDTREETGLLPELTLPTMGGQLRIPISQPDSIDPLLTKSRDFINFSGLIYEGLFSMIRT